MLSSIFTREPDLISSLIAIVALKSAFNHLNRLDSEYRSAEAETLYEIAA
jgi:hypothetical protein